MTDIPGAVHAVARLSAAEFDRWFEAFMVRLGAQGAHIVGPYVCPHRFAEPCSCKKPNALLYARAAADHDIEAAEAVIAAP